MKEVLFKESVIDSTITIKQLISNTLLNRQVVMAVLVSDSGACFLIHYNDQTGAFARNPFYFLESIGLVHGESIEALVRSMSNPRMYMFDNFKEFVKHAAINDWH